MSESNETNLTVDWSIVTFEGNRLAQHRAFLRLSFAEKLQALEDMAEVVKEFWGRPANEVRGGLKRIEGS
jgi:hypothetical protein